MKIEILESSIKNSFTIVEKKGIGHPDTLADLLAEELSWQYSKYSIDTFGDILNHNIDKVVLNGGTAKLTFGNGELLSPIRCHAFGKATLSVGDKKVPMAEIFNQAAKRTFDSIFGDNIFEKYEIQTELNLNSGIGAEHVSRYYSPANTSDVLLTNQNLTLTDTAVTASFQPFNSDEILCIELERLLNSRRFKLKYPETGWDIKVFVQKYGNNRSITVCIPAIASQVKSEDKYRKLLIALRSEIEVFCLINKCTNCEIFINTKDTLGKGYLTLFGTALDKGDIGVVGRGNKSCGFISLTRPNIVESTPGKNPIRSTGVVCQTAANQISVVINSDLGLPNTVFVSGNNGDKLDNLNVFIQIDNNKKIPHVLIKQLAEKCCSNIESALRSQLKISPLQRILDTYHAV